MLYLQLGCLLSLVLQIVSSKLGLQIKEGQSFWCDFFLLYGLLHRDRSEQIKPQPWDPAGQLLLTVLLCTTIQSMYYIDSISVISKSLRNWWVNIYISYS